MEQPKDDLLIDLQIDRQSIGFLGETARWARFLAILGFILCGILVILAFFLGSYFAGVMSSMYGGAGIFGGAFFTAFYLATALLLFFPTLFLYNFSTKMRNAIRNNNQQVLSDSFKNLKSYFKFHGILAIIILSVYALALVAAVIGAMVGHR